MTSGDYLALMDANWITAMRTGAVATHSIKLFAKNGFKTLAVLGLGNTARATMLCLAHAFPDREFKVKLLKYKGQEVLFSERFSQYENLHFEYINHPKALIRGAEVVISCVTFFAG